MKRPSAAQGVMLWRWNHGFCMTEGCGEKPDTVASRDGGRFFVGCQKHAQEVPAKSNRAGWRIGGKCPFCSGSGFLPRLRHVDRGICYRCNGTGIFGFKHQTGREDER